MSGDFFTDAMREARLSEVAPPLQDRVKVLRDIANGFERSQALYTAMELGLFDLLKRPASAAEICEKTGIRDCYATGFLDMLASLGTLVKADGRYATSPDLAPFLDETSPYYARYLHYSAHRRQLWANLGDTLRGAHTPPDARGFEGGIDAGGVDSMAYNALLGRLQYIVRTVAGMDEFKLSRKMIDLGGGHGLFAIAFAQENPLLEASVFDRPEVVEHAEKYIARAGLDGRVKPMAGDYTIDDIGDGYDVVLDICSLAGSEDRARSFYGKVANSLNIGGIFVKTTFTLDDDKCGPPLTLMFDLEEKLSGHGHVHLSNGELTEMLRSEGLDLVYYGDMSDQVDVPMRTFVFKKR